MTIILGALCRNEDGTPAAVLASDRMVTWANMTEYEHHVPKVSPIAGAVVAISGDALAGARIVADVRSELRDQAVTVEDVANGLATRFASFRMEFVEAQVLMARGLSLKDFYDRHANLLPQIAGMIDQQMVQVPLNVQLLVAGVDHTGAHAFSIENPGGTVVNHDSIGHVAIGSGMIHALQSMIGFEHTYLSGLRDTIVQVFISKRRAELAPGVGSQTDLLVVTVDGVRRLTDDAMTALDGINAKINTALREAFDGTIDAFSPEYAEAFGDA